MLACPSCHERIEVPKAAPRGAVIGEVVEESLLTPSGGKPTSNALEEFWRSLFGGQPPSPHLQLAALVGFILIVLAALGVALAIVLTHK
jgi:hypothetical protein